MTYILDDGTNTITTKNKDAAYELMQILIDRGLNVDVTWTKGEGVWQTS